tara:strand:- start:4061 stop:5056 length:996 start_codon:yes stop_codon:yes gene_type:complete
MNQIISKMNTVCLAFLSLLMAVFNLFIFNTSVAQPLAPLPKDSDEIEVLAVQGKIYLIGTAGSNIAVMAGDSGLIVVDSGNIEASENVINAIREISSEPSRFIINTTVLPEHMGGNIAISDIGETYDLNAAVIDTREGYSISIIGHGNGLLLLGTEFADEVPYEAWPNDTFFSERKTISLNGEAIEILYQPAAITNSDIMVHFRQSDVLVTGDIFDTTSYPRFKPEYGGSIQGVIDALNRVIDIAVPLFNQQGGTLIIPGHGHLANESDVVEYRDMLTIIRDRVRLAIDQGMSFEEVLAANLTLEYDGLYGHDTGDWTTHMFLEAVYDELR